MKFTLEVDLDNAAFEDGDELFRLLSRVAAAVPFVASPGDGGSVRDSNGNTVGKRKVEE